MPDVREILYPNFPRMVGNPKSFLIYNRDELNRFASINSSDNDKNFASCCSYYNDVPVFEDSFFETDEITPEPVRKVVLWFESHKIPWICLHSGSRGFHLHGLFQSDMVNSRTVKNFSNLILEETGTKGLFDSHVSGVLEKLCRIPNTQRLGNGWCVPITKEELFTIDDPVEYKKLCIAPRFLNYNIIKRPSIFEFIKEEEYEDKPVKNISIAPPKEIFYIKHILRPCIYKAITSPNPRHDFRVSAVVEMLNHGLSVDQIFNIFERLQWIDFDHSKTRYQIEFIAEKRKNGEFVIPYGKRRLGCDKKMTCLKCVLIGE
jgi:hypothetical protein